MVKKIVQMTICLFMVAPMSAMDSTSVKLAETEPAAGATEGGEAAQKRARVGDEQDLHVEADANVEVSFPMVQPALGTPGRFAHWKFVNLAEDVELRALFLKLLEETPHKLLEPDKQRCGWTWFHALMDNKNIAFIRMALEKLRDLMRNGLITIDSDNGLYPKDFYGDSPVHVACWKGQFDCVGFLLQNGGHLCLNNRKESPIHFLSYNYPEAAVRLLRGPNRRFLETLDDDGCSPKQLGLLKSVVKCTDPVVWGVTMLTETRERDSGFNLIHLLAAKNLVTLFREKHNQEGHDLNIRTQETPVGFRKYYNTGQTALHVAAERGHDQFVAVLLALGAQKHCLDDDDGLTALELAVNNGHTKCLKLLLPSKEELSEDKEAVRTIHRAAYIAAQKGRLQDVQLLFNGAEDKKAIARKIVKEATRPWGVRMFRGNPGPWNVVLLRTYYPYYYPEANERKTVELTLNAGAKVIVPREFIDSSTSLKRLVEPFIGSSQGNIDAHAALKNCIQPPEQLFLLDAVTPEVWKLIEPFMQGIADYYYLHKAFKEFYGTWEDRETNDVILSCGLKKWLDELITQHLPIASFDQIKAFQKAALALDIPLLLAVANKAYANALRTLLNESVAQMPGDMRQEFLYRLCLDVVIENDRGEEAKNLLDAEDGGGWEMTYLSNFVRHFGE
jgi:ankyrin repeat protein